jgi:hypothetical protein
MDGSMRRTIPWRTVAASLVFLCGAAPAATHRDPRALAVADSVVAAVAPAGAWEKIAGLRFEFAVVKKGEAVKTWKHVWDTREGRYRIEGEGPDGDHCLVLFNVNTRKGEAWILKAGQIKGNPDEQVNKTVQAWHWSRIEEQAALAKLLEFAHGRFLNDTFWLLMPLKMKDPGVNLDDDGEKTLDGKIFDVVKVTFEGAGSAPGDAYRVFADRTTHLVDRWEHSPQGPDAKERSVWIWKDWTNVGPLRLSLTRTRSDGGTSISFRKVEVLAEIPAGSFKGPN